MNEEDERRKAGALIAIEYAQPPATTRQRRVKAFRVTAPLPSFPDAAAWTTLISRSMSKFKAYKMDVLVAVSLRLHRQHDYVEGTQLRA